MKYLLLLLTALSILSCSKDKLGQRTKTSLELMQSALKSGTTNPEQVYNDIINNATGVFGFSAYKSPFVIYQNGRFQGYYKTGYVDKGNTVLVNSYAVQPDSTNNYLLLNNASILPLYNANTTLNFGYKLGGVDRNFVKNYKLPSFLELVNDGNFNTINATLSSTTSIRWQPDPVNTDTYVFISLYYDPTHPNNPGSGSTTIITEYISLGDAGVYQFTASDLKRIPNNAYTFVSIYRGNIAIDTDAATNKKFVVGGYSCVQMSARVSK